MLRSTQHPWDFIKLSNNLLQLKEKIGSDKLKLKNDQEIRALPTYIDADWILYLNSWKVKWDKILENLGRSRRAEPSRYRLYLEVGHSAPRRERGPTEKVCGHISNPCRASCWLLTGGGEANNRKTSEEWEWPPRDVSYFTLTLKMIFNLTVLLWILQLELKGEMNPSHLVETLV